MQTEHFKLRLEEILEGSSQSSLLFNRVLILAIVVNVILLTLNTVGYIHQRFGDLILYIEIGFTLVFSVEYLLRVYSAKSARKYIFSFYGLIDFFAIFPFYLSLVYPPLFYLANAHFLRIIRIFRVLKLMRFLGGIELLHQAFYRCKQRIAVFILTMFIICIAAATLMFAIEGPANGFLDIPTSLYWSLVTVTTVGYGDIVPLTTLGRMISVILMFMGYVIIAVTTGIFTVELSDLIKHRNYETHCGHCDRRGHAHDAIYCKYCGQQI